MCDGIDAPGKATHYGDAVADQFSRHKVCHLPAVGGGLSGADDGDTPIVLLFNFTEYVDDGGLVIDLLKSVGVEIIVPDERGDAAGLQVRHRGVRVYGRAPGLDGGDGAFIETGSSEVGGAGSPSGGQGPKIGFQCCETCPADARDPVERDPVLNILHEGRF